MESLLIQQHAHSSKESRQWNEPQPPLEPPADLTASTHLLIHPFLFPFPFLSSV